MHEALHVSLPKPDDVAKNALGRHGNFIKDFAHALDHATVLLEPFVTKERYATLRMEKCGIEGVRFFDAAVRGCIPVVLSDPASFRVAEVTRALGPGPWPQSSSCARGLADRVWPRAAVGRTSTRATGRLFRPWGQSA